ncbi:hypothetical protein ACQR1I_27725 [Bradyrhizobium sp. HKCCYLS2038]|uniref:hypothetical protein n=1 Tax=unclassified Bradyrhizobium TaxID=2631580 RepID=UPI003EC0076A
MSDILANASLDPDADTDLTDLPEAWRRNASAVKPAATPLLPVQVDRSRQLASLDPVVMPSPPPERLEFSAVFRLGAAVAVLSCIAFIAIRVMQAPKIDTAARSGIAAASSYRNIGLTDKLKLEDGPAAANANAPADSIVASIPAVKPAPNGRETPQSIPPKASRMIATASPAPVAAALSKDEISEMLARGRDLIGAGDVASARLILALVAEGDAEASLMLAGTYDPAVLSKVKAVGVAPDLATARAWYTRAAELGSAEARRHLE